MAYAFARFTPADVPLLQALNAVFGEVFGEPEKYLEKPLSVDYREKLLGRDDFIVLVDREGNNNGRRAYRLRIL
jgi:hypothetical protein